MLSYLRIGIVSSIMNSIIDAIKNYFFPTVQLIQEDNDTNEERDQLPTMINQGSVSQIPFSDPMDIIS